jgi:hypothetical protein
LTQIIAAARIQAHVRRMDGRADMLRHRVALYRRYLAEGVCAELAIVYLREIAEAEAELAGIAGQGEPGDRRG